MSARRRSWIPRIALTLLGLLVIGGRPSAQPMRPAPLESGLSQPEVDTEPWEMTPRLFLDARGDMLRLWQRLIPPESGRVMLAARAARDWQPLLEVDPKEDDVTTNMGDLAVGSAGRLAVAYQWWRKKPTVAKQIRVIYSSDGGKTWTPSPTRLDQSNKAFTPKAAWGRDGNLVVVWADEIRGTRTWDIYTRRSTDGGATWEGEQLLSRFAVNSPTDAYVRPELASDGNETFWALWVGSRGSRDRLYLNRSTDGGRTWTDPLELTGPAFTVTNHHVLRSNNRLLVIWNDRRTGRDRVFAVTSADGGVSWTPPARVDHVPDDLPTDAFAPAAVMSPSGEVFVAWQDGRNGRDDIFVGRSTDWGLTWEKEIRIDMDEPGTAESRFARIARAADGRVAVAWEDDRVGYEGVYLRVRSAGSRPAWGAEMLVQPPGDKLAARTPVVLWGKDGSLTIAWELFHYVSGPLLPKRKMDTRTLRLDPPK